jgi:hypothetical protein
VVWAVGVLAGGLAALGAVVAGAHRAAVVIGWALVVWSAAGGVAGVTHRRGVTR